MAVGHALDRCLAVVRVARLGLGRDQHHATAADARQHAGVVGLGEVLQVVHGPAEEAIAPVRVPAGKGQAGQAAVLVDPPVRQGLRQVRRGGEDQRRLVVVADMERRLGGILEARITERLRAEIVALAGRARIVAEQVDIVAVVGLVGGADQHLQCAHPFAVAQRQVAPVGPGADLVEHQHVFAAQQRTAAVILAGQLLDETGQPDLRVHAQGLEKGRAPVALAVCLPAQCVGAWRVVGKMLAGEGFLFVQQAFDGRRLVGKQGLKRLHLHITVQLRLIAQGQQAAQRVIGPGLSVAGQARQQAGQGQQDKCFHGASHAQDKPAKANLCRPWQELANGANALTDHAPRRRHPPKRRHDRGPPATIHRKTQKSLGKSALSL